ncbi:MAG: amino acid permease [Bacteroidetes bacterium]|nr:amino acid permease [Bacteroidota bacterium]
MKSKKYIGFFTATSIVIANMIGTGVFTSMGFQVMGIHSGFALLLLWVIGGVAALTGALCYGELGAALPRSGGEYNFLSQIYHPTVGFLSGWVSATVGFAAPVAASAIALGSYLSRVFPSFNPMYVASCIVVLLTVVHVSNVKTGRGVQNFLTTLNVIVIFGIIVFGIFSARTGSVHFMPAQDAIKDILSPAFGVALFFVSFAYSGWNASTYITGEIDNPQKNLPKSLFIGTMLVLFLYVMLNFIFLYTVPLSEMKDAGGNPVVDIGSVAAVKIFGETGGKVIAVVISLLLLSSVSSMIMAGPRVTQVMGEDFHLFRFFAKKNKNNIPFIAILAQSCITLFFIFTSTFEAVITYIGFTLNLFTFLSVLGLFVLRIKKPGLSRPYKTWGYPITPIVFLCMGGWLLVYGLMYKQTESLAGLATVGIGLSVYFLDPARLVQNKVNKTEK